MSLDTHLITTWLYCRCEWSEGCRALNKVVVFLDAKHSPIMPAWWHRYCQSCKRVRLISSILLLTWFWHFVTSLQLEELYLDDNDFSEGLNPAIARLGRLKLLSLESCHLTSIADWFECLEVVCTLCTEYCLPMFYFRHFRIRMPALACSFP